MTSGDNNKRGFGAFDDLVSDVSKEVDTPVQTAAPASEPAKNTKAPIRENSPSDPQQIAEAISQNTAGGGKGDTPWGWIVFWVFVVFVMTTSVWEVGMTLANHKPYTDRYISKGRDFSGELFQQEPYTDPAAGAATATDSTAPEANANTEEKPPVGDGLVLSYNQIRYCLSEDIRLSAIKDALDSYSHHEVESFNTAIGDYNSRCSHFRYHRGALESVRAEVNPLHATLVVEGLHRLDSWRGSVSQPANTSRSKEKSNRKAKNQSTSKDSSAQPREERNLTPDEDGYIECGVNGWECATGNNT